MSTLRQAAELLSAATTIRGASQVARHLGFGEPVSLELATALALDVDGLRRAAIAEGSGIIRCCVVVAEPDVPVRQVAAQSLARLTERSPHILWMVLVVQPARHALVLAVAPAPGSHRVSALVVDTRRVQDSDAETLASMSAASGASDVLTHHRWRELLGRDALTRRFYRELESVVGELASTAAGRAPEEARREIALLTASRLLFLAFLEAKGWLDSDREFLRHHLDARCAAGGGVPRQLLEPLFFGTLNTPAARRASTARSFGRVPFLNGGLFSRAPVERRWRECTLRDDALGRMIVGLLGSYRVTAREESTAWSEAAIDPEMLGRAFESLMASDDRRKSGAFYTPPTILERVTAEGLDLWIEGIAIPEGQRERLRCGDLVAVEHRAAALGAIDAVRVLDPACGSGAFLVHALERLAEMRRSAGDARPVSARRRDVLSRSIFGVDVNPTAVWLCELRLWLSMVIDAEERDGMRVAPLPNLDHHIRVGDALAGAAFGDGWHPGDVGPLAAARTRYTRATGARKRTLARTLAGAERRLALTEARRHSSVLSARRRELLSSLRGRDLFQSRIVPTAQVRDEVDALRVAARAARRRVDAIRQGAALPFSFRTQFADAGAAGGFDVVIGNPPWVRLHRITPALRADFARRYRSWREATWSDGALDAHAGRGFASQVDLAALFTERATQLARDPGAISLLLPSKLWTSLSGGGIRRVLSAECQVTALEDWSESKSAFDAVVYPSLLVARRARAGDHSPMRGAVHRGDSMLRWETSSESVPLDDSAGAPWLLLPPEVRHAFDQLTSHGQAVARRENRMQRSLHRRTSPGMARCRVR
jgi:hypothetical protein